MFALLLAIGCNSSEKSPLLSDFSLVDVNPNSSRYQEQVSPRDYMGQRSGWYFGHAT